LRYQIEIFIGILDATKNKKGKRKNSRKSPAGV
jgi:hypothetical protein